MAEPALDMLREGYDAYPLVDGISITAHEGYPAPCRGRHCSAYHRLRLRLRDHARLGSLRLGQLRELVGWYFPKKTELGRGEGIV